MRFTEINLFGVYVAPMFVMIVAAWLMFTAFRRLTGRFGLFQRVWHPALFEFSIYMMLLSGLVLFFAS